ncbi:MAG TPA: hypothetical protein VL945_00325, partial [Candidatus Saccharimonadales bacterium]|nr:hypothetical protein [Candidatus Saccharimonadales bacterium]
MSLRLVPREPISVADLALSVRSLEREVYARGKIERKVDTLFSKGRIERGVALAQRKGLDEEIVRRIGTARIRWFLLSGGGYKTHFRNPFDIFDTEDPETYDSHYWKSLKFASELAARFANGADWIENGKPKTEFENVLRIYIPRALVERHPEVVLAARSAFSIKDGPFLLSVKRGLGKVIVDVTGESMRYAVEVEK